MVDRLKNPLDKKVPGITFALNFQIPFCISMSKNDEKKLREKYPVGLSSEFKHRFLKKLDNCKTEQELLIKNSKLRKNIIVRDKHDILNEYSLDFVIWKDSIIKELLGEKK